MTSGVKINSLDPNAGSADELAAIEANKSNKGPQAPDIVDVGYAYGATGIAAGDYQAYKVSTWSSRFLIQFLAFLRRIRMVCGSAAITASWPC